jgi:hypothetical protein
MDAIVESYLLLYMLGTAVAGLLGTPDMLMNSFFIGSVLVLEKLITIFHSNAFLDEFIPRNLAALLSGRPVGVQAPLPVVEPSSPVRPQRIEDVLSVR